MISQDEVQLKINGNIYYGWKSVSIKRSLKAISGAFDLSVADKWAEQKAAWQITPGDKAQLSVGSETLITGYIDRVSPSYNATSRSISIRGRDSSSDLVDCSAEFYPGVWFSIRFDKLVKTICDKFGVGLTVDPSASANAAEVIYAAVIQPGQSAFEFIEHHARLRRVLLTNDGSGNVVITLAGKTRASNDFVEGQNIKGASADYDNSERFSKVVVKCQSLPTDGTDPSSALQAMGTANDSVITRYRPKIIQPEGNCATSDCIKRAQWEVKVRAAKSQKCKITTQGWRQKNGQLWALNQIVGVKSNWLGMSSDFLITDLEFRKDDSSGTETEIGLERTDAYTIDPTLKDTKDGILKLKEQDASR